MLRNTVFWLSNAGRHYPPWNGRHHSVMGIEDVTANFHYGLAESAKKNPHSTKGFPTRVQLSPTRPLAINYIMAIAAIPSRFDKVASIKPSARHQSVIIRSANGREIETALDVNFLTEKTGADDRT